MGGPPGMGGAQPVEVVPVSRQRMADRVESVGTAVANESVVLTAKVTDTVSRIHFQDAEFVEQGAILLEQTNRAEAARLAEARASAEEARRHHDRMLGLASANLISPAELEEAQTRHETAQARLEGVIANMEDRVIRAPFSGVLGFRKVSEGSLLTTATEITTLDDISVIKLDFTIPERHLARLQPGQPVHANSLVFADEAFEGEVQVVGSRVDPVTRSVQVRAHIDNPDGNLRPGMLMTVSLTLSETDRIVVPEQAVVPSQGKHYVFVVDDESMARRIEVEVGRRQPGIVEIVSGVNPGQLVITQGIGQVRPGMRVRVMNTSLPGLARPEARSNTEVPAPRQS